MVGDAVTSLIPSRGEYEMALPGARHAVKASFRNDPGYAAAIWQLAQRFKMPPPEVLERLAGVVALRVLEAAAAGRA